VMVSGVSENMGVRAADRLGGSVGREPCQRDDRQDMFVLEAKASLFSWSQGRCSLKWLDRANIVGGDCGDFSRDVREDLLISGRGYGGRCGCL
jgi:hypothetical protein